LFAVLRLCTGTQPFIRNGRQSTIADFVANSRIQQEAWGKWLFFRRFWNLWSPGDASVRQFLGSWYRDLFERSLFWL